MSSADLVTLLTALAFGYLLGSIPFGLVLTWSAGRGDIRTIGSGNIGATNVLRTGSKTLAAATLIADALKGTIPALLVDYFLGREAGLAAGLGAFLGHVFPVWLRFQGGKGVATYIGVLLAVAWPAAVAFVAAWLTMAALFRVSSLAALSASVATPLVLFAVDARTEGAVFAMMSAILWFTHRSNITRLLSGTEPRIGSRS